MYLVKDSNLCKSLVERAKDTAVLFHTTLIEEIEQNNVFETFPIYENIDISNMKRYESAIFLYSRESFTNINDKFKKCLELYGIPKNKTIKASKSNITRFEYVFKKSNTVFFIQDPNDLSIINWKREQELC